MNPKCKECRWWVKPKREETKYSTEVGKCKYNPPVFVDGGSDWPRTQPTNFCSKFATNLTRG